MDNINHQIILRLNSQGYKGEEIDKILPDFMANRETMVGLSWYPSIYGPESYELIIQIGILFSLLSKSFLNELSKDLYHWVKSKLVKLFQKKKQSNGFIHIEFKDVKIDFYTESNKFNETQVLLNFFKYLSEIIFCIDPNLSIEWKVYWDDSLQKFISKPIISNTIKG